MTIEQKIKKFAKTKIKKGWGIPIEVSDPTNFPWRGKPMSICTDIGGLLFISILFDKKSLEKIDNMIKEADETECLTSNSEYVRKCKKYYMKIK